MIFYYPDEYVLVGDVEGRHESPVNGHKYLRRLLPGLPCPSNYRPIREICGNKVYDSKGRLKPKFWALKRILHNQLLNI